MPDETAATATDQPTTQGSGPPRGRAAAPGRLLARRLEAHGVTKLFTLSGGHLFSIYDGGRAEGWAKVTREPGLAALTAGPGVTNGMSAMARAQQNHSPMLVLGRARAGHALGPGVAPGDRPRAVARR